MWDMSSPTLVSSPQGAVRAAGSAPHGEQPDSQEHTGHQTSLEQRPGHCFQQLLNEFMLRKRQVTFITESGELNIHIYLLKKIIYICSKALPSLKDKHHLVTKLKK